MRKRLIGMVICLRVIAAPGTLWAQSETGTVAAVLGALQIQRGGAWQNGSIGTPVFAGDRLRTGAEDQARLVFGDDSVLDLAPATEVSLAKQVFSGTGHRFDSQLRLGRGKIQAWIGDAYRAAHSHYEIETPTAIATMRGTQLIVVYDADAEVTQVICVAGEVEVAGTLGVIGGNLQVGPQQRSLVAKGRFPAAPERLDAAHLQETFAGVELTGTGRRDGLSVEHAGTTGRLWAPQDTPGLSAAPAAKTAAEGVEVSGLQESLAERLSPDVRANSQPLLEFKFAPPDKLPPGGVTVHF